MGTIMQAVIRRGITSAFIILFSQVALQAAYLRNVPQNLIQPDGEQLSCFASGDEFYNWLHDEQGRVIRKNPATGYYEYCTFEDGDWQVTGYRPGQPIPPSLQAALIRMPSAEKVAALRHDFFQDSGTGAPLSAPAPRQGSLNNLVIFIRFSDESESGAPLSQYQTMFNNASPSSNSMYQYFYQASYNQLSIVTSFFPQTSGSQVVSFQDSHPRGYYMPIGENVLGYSSANERRIREHTLLNDAVTSISSQVPSGLNIDADDDGYVDNICFIVSGSPTGWNSLLWPHQWALYTYEVTLAGKRVYTYNFQLQDYLGSNRTGVLCHEMFHSLGAPDLYHYSFDGHHPVGSWDLMEYDLNPPQHMSAYMKYRYGNWISTLPEISSAGTYSLQPLTAATNNCFKIASPNSSSEFFVVEYRKKNDIFESSLPGEGLVIYRINGSNDGRGNSDGPPDEVYVYRPGGTTSKEGAIADAAFSREAGRELFNDFSDPACFLSKGGPGGIAISNISSLGSTISFTLGQSTDPILSVVPVDFDLGTRAAGSSFSSTFTIQNQDGDQLQGQITESAAWIANLSPTTFSLSSKQMISVTFSGNFPSAPGPFSTYIAVTSNGGNQNVHVHGAVEGTGYLPAPVLRSPLANAGGVGTKTWLSWKSVNGATRYEVQVDQHIDFNSPDVSEAVAGTTRLMIDGLEHRQPYYWRVRAISPTASSAWSDLRAFTTMQDQSVQILAPDNYVMGYLGLDEEYYIDREMVITSLPVSMQKMLWIKTANDDQSNGDENMVTLHFFKQTLLYIAFDHRATSVPSWLSSQFALTDTTIGVSDRATPLSIWRAQFPAGTYSFGGPQASGGVGARSNYIMIIDAQPVVGQPVLLSPADSSFDVPSNPTTFVWNKVENAKWYYIKISTKKSSAGVIDYQFNITDTTYKSYKLEPNKTYYWQLQASKEDSRGDWSYWHQFTTAGIGQLTVILSPESIRSAGRWRLANGPQTGWQNSGTTLTGVPTGHYLLQFSEVPGWDKPLDRTIHIGPGNQQEVGVYTVAKGSLAVTIEPEEITPLAFWRILAGPDTQWKRSGETIPDLTIGSYTLQFSEITNWHKPEDRIITITQGSNSEKGIYQALTGSLTMLLEPESVRPFAQWRIAAGTDTSWKYSGETLLSLPIGLCQVQFSQVMGWISPEQMQLQIQPGSNDSSAYYTRLTGSLYVTVDPAEIRDLAFWRLLGAPDSSWKKSSEISELIPTGSYMLTFCDLPGWNKPPDRAITILQGFNTQTASYTHKTGSLTVILEPARGVEDARWRLSAGPDTVWHASNFSIMTLPTGSYQLQFLMLPNWIEPAERTIIITEGNTNVRAAYTVATGFLVVTLEPVQITRTAQWRLASGPDTQWKASGDTLYNLQVGNYPLQFLPMYGWYQPPDTTLIILKGANSYTGRYRGAISGVELLSSDAIPDSYHLSEGFPNPFNQTVSFQISLPKSGMIDLFILDPLGRRVRSIMHGISAAGIHQYGWDGRDDRSHFMPSGIYFLIMDAGGKRQVRKITLAQ